MTITDEMCGLVVRTANAMAQGVGRRRYMADTITSLELGQREAQTLFGWGRDTIRKALHEQRSGISCCDAFSQRGRKPAEHHLPRLLEDIRDLVQDQCQTDGTFKTTRLYCRLSVATVRRQLVARKGYSNEELPTIQTLTTKMNDLGFRLRKVAKCRVKKNSPDERDLHELEPGACRSQDRRVRAANVVGRQSDGDFGPFRSRWL